MHFRSIQIGFMACLFLVASVSVACNAPKEPSRASPEELSQMNRDFVKALNARDAVAAANLYTEDAVILPPNEGPVTGRANIQKYWEAAIAAGAFDAAVATTTTGSNGDLGYEVGRLQMSIKAADGSVTTEHGKFIEMLRKGDDGKWKSFYAMWNNDTLALK
jgi:uncharacterized protein (TIGR02246 family)